MRHLLAIGIFGAFVAFLIYQDSIVSSIDLKTLTSTAIIWASYFPEMLHPESPFPSGSGRSLFDLKAPGIDGNLVDLSAYRGNVVLVINVASQCGFTESSYQKLVELHGRYKNLGFEIFAFPCDQFGAQEPDSNEQVKKFVQSEYGVEFPLFAKSEVNGDNANDVFKFLKSFFPGSISWNFHGIWLVDKTGTPRYRFSSPDFQEIEAKIRAIFSS